MNMAFLFSVDPERHCDASHHENEKRRNGDQAEELYHLR
jgi:hypothetical protein